MNVISHVVSIMLVAALVACGAKHGAPPAASFDANPPDKDSGKARPDLSPAIDMSPGAEVSGPLGPAVEDLRERGGGACSEKTVGDVIAQIHADAPALKDVAELFRKNPNRLGDQSFIYAFRASDGGFRLVFKRGTVDCQAGCADNEYWYFETDAACIGKQVGHFHLKADGACTGHRLWRFPDLAVERMCGT